MHDYAANFEFSETPEEVIWWAFPFFNTLLCDQLCKVSYMQCYSNTLWYLKNIQCYKVNDTEININGNVNRNSNIFFQGTVTTHFVCITDWRIRMYTHNYNSYLTIMIKYFFMYSFNQSSQISQVAKNTIICE